MGFKANDQWYGHIHGIVCSNDIIFAQGWILEWQTIFQKGVFIFFPQKKHFPFLGAKNQFFMKSLTNISCKIATHHLKKYYTTFYVLLTKWLLLKSFRSTSRQIDKILLI